MVVLPAPLGPTSAASWPGSMRIEMSSSVHSRGTPSASAMSPGEAGVDRSPGSS